VSFNNIAYAFPTVLSTSEFTHLQLTLDQAFHPRGGKTTKTSKALSGVTVALTRTLGTRWEIVNKATVRGVCPPPLTLRAL